MCARSHGTTPSDVIGSGCDWPARDCGDLRYGLTGGAIVALAVRPTPGGQLLEGFPAAKDLLVETSRVGLDCDREHTNVKLVNIGGRKGTRTPDILLVSLQNFLPQLLTDSVALTFCTVSARSSPLSQL